MRTTFSRYFFNYILRARTRQMLLLLAIVGLHISAFALLVMQSTMGGLQRNLVGRSKAISGDMIVIPKDFSNKEVKTKLLDDLKKQEIAAVPEYELEVLAKKNNTIIPVIIHGVDPNGRLPLFLDDLEFEKLVMPFEVSYKLGVTRGDEVRIISPAHVNHFMGDIPRMMTLPIDAMIATDVPEIDGFHLWVSLPRVQNLIRARDINRIRVYGGDYYDEVKSIVESKYPDQFKLLSWEQQNDALVWALSLENRMIVFLFVGMTLLVSLCITSGLFIFFYKIKTDLASFWILGTSKVELVKASKIFLNLMGVMSVLGGLALGLVFLFILDRADMNIMPDVFVDRKIPVYITFKGLALSFLIPTGISITFSHLALNSFKKENDYLEHIRSVGK